MKIGNIQKISLIEYPGKICAVIFTQGCNFKCPYCHNPELVNPELFTDPVPEKKILNFLKERRGKLDAVVLTGGEPTLNADSLDFIKEVKDMGYLIKLDTNGTQPQFIETALQKKLLDYIAMDIKAPLQKYDLATRVVVNIADITSSITIIMKSSIPYEFRTTLVKSILTPHDVINIGKMIQGASQYILQRFVSSKHVDGAFINDKSLDENEISDIIFSLNKVVKHCVIRS